MSTEKHKPTEQQEAIISSHRSGTASVMVVAGAGCAKSSTLRMAAPQVKCPALSLAFNRSIAEEMKTGENALPGNFEVKTMNGLGHSAFARAHPGLSIKLDDKKLGKIATQTLKDLKIKTAQDEWGKILSMVKAAQMAGIVPGNEGNYLTFDDEHSWNDLADAQWLDASERGMIIDVAHQVLRENNRQTLQGVISFDDQIYASLMLGGQFGQFPHVFVDEAQDLNPLNHLMVERSLRPGGRLTVVGDPKQAIYAFRGADHKSMGTMRGLRSQWVDHMLSLTFRCPKVVVARQWDHFPEFRAGAGNIEGIFATLGLREEDEGEARWGIAEVMRLAQGTMPAVLCKNNAPLFSLAFKFIKQGIGVNMLGRDIGKGLSDLGKKLWPETSTGAAACVLALVKWRDHEVGLAMANEDEKKADSIHDRAECLLAVFEGGARTAGEALAAIERLFANGTPGVVLSTIHKSKGLEWDTVLILDPWRIPSKRARLAAEAGRPGELEQELNLRYVVETRSKRVLLHASLSGFK